MTQAERRAFLIRVLLREDPDARDMTLPEDEQQQKQLLRGLMNVRPPLPVSDAFLSVQDDYLAFERESAGVVDGDALPATRADGRLVLWQGDITTLKVDAIVNAANSALLGCFRPLHSCIDNIVHSKSGIQLRLSCHELMTRQSHEEPTGQAKITPAFNLPCRYVLHTVGPIIDGPLTQEDRELLASCYSSCLSLAAENKLETIAFCCISTGLFHFPNQDAAEIAVATVKEYLKNQTSVRKVIFNVFKDQDYAIYRGLLGKD